MSYNERLAQRIRELFPTDVAFTEKRMFGGLAFLINGNMSITVSGKGGILVRVDPQQNEKLSKKHGVETAVMRGKKMNGWLRVQESQLRTKKQLLLWLSHSVAFAQSLPAKK